MKEQNRTKDVILTGMFAAVLAVLSQLSVPMPSGVPVTLQTFAVALTAYVLGWKKGAAATAVYILLGAVGVPVFANFSGGFGVILGSTGGFIWGFLFMVVLAGAGMQQENRGLLILLGALGLAACHLLGTLQFMAVMHMGFGESFVLVSAPYLLKDAVSMIAAYFIALAVRRALAAAGAAVGA